MRPTQHHKILKAKFYNVQRVQFAFILKAEVPLHRTDGAHHLETQSNQHRLREEPFPIKCQFRLLQQKKVAVIGLAPLKKDTAV